MKTKRSRPFMSQSKWRKAITIPMEMVKDRPGIVEEIIRKGYRYDKGFVATSHRAGIINDDFRGSPMAIVFFLMRAPRILQRNKG